METKITVTRYNVTTLIGWIGLLLGLVGAALRGIVTSIQNNNASVGAKS
jgi:hypothetical protein